MGPARKGELYSLVGLVPDEQLNGEEESGSSWRSRGDLSKMLETYNGYPSWMKAIFPLLGDLGLWQLRDLEPLKTWTRGRAILVGDAAHTMLPTRGQGASQALEDAEALGAFFADIEGPQDTNRVAGILEEIFKCRYDRACLIQKHSRLAARPATNEDSTEITM